MFQKEGREHFDAGLSRGRSDASGKRNAFAFCRKEEASEQIFLSPLRAAPFSDTLTAKTGVAYAAYHFAPQGV